MRVNEGQKKVIESLVSTIVIPTRRSLVMERIIVQLESLSAYATVVADDEQLHCRFSGLTKSGIRFFVGCDESTYLSDRVAMWQKEYNK